MDIVKSEINMANEVELCVEVGSNIGDTLLENSDINQLCRTCANTHDNMIPIFEGDGLEHDLQNKIDKHFPVNISKDDGLPNKMCFQCASTLVAWHDMFTGCIEAEKKLKHLLDKLKDDGQVGESVFGSSVVSEDSASDNLKAQQKTGSEMEIDNDDGNDDDYAPEHGGDDDDEDDDDEEEEEEDEEDDDLETEVVLHKLDAKEKEKTVEVSEKGTTIRDQDEKEVSKELIEVKPTTSIMQRIGKLIASTESAEVAQKKDRGIINRRRERVRDECEVCGKFFTTRNALSEHRRIHTGERPYVCDECGKAFRTSATLYTHGKSHSDVRPYICEICKRGFKCNQQLQRHISIHTGERDFVCDVCGKDFRRKNDLTSHLSVHNDAHPYTCDTCGKEFRSNASLKRHLPLHDDTKAYTCPMCLATFHHRRYLGNHLRLKHKVTLTEIVKRGETIETPVTEFFADELIFLKE
ncbi:hypothetical protein LSTR_LSTR002927 [Laodelphax striatellus]|uniref:Protein krueppel n=1 Tax=Laodelphax striatellus TaxID=195883 RepID=A0A482XKI9_LAOST|nr:hypothetical protein LSTR_LSTR002927 [Laodelphax striatellus]